MGVLDYFYSATEESQFISKIEDARLAYTKEKKRFTTDVRTLETLDELESDLASVKKETNLVLEVTVAGARNYFRGEETVTKIITDIRNILSVSVTKNRHLFELDIYLPSVSRVALQTTCDIETVESILNTVDETYAFNIHPLKYKAESGRYESLYGMEEISGSDKCGILKMIQLSKA